MNISCVCLLHSTHNPQCFQQAALFYLTPFTSAPKWYRNAEAHGNVRPEFRELRLDGSWWFCLNAFEEIMWVSALRGVNNSGLWAWDILAFLTSNFSADAFIWKCECLGPLRASCVHSVKYSSIFSVFLSMWLCNDIFYCSLMHFHSQVGRKSSHETWSFVPSCI